MEEPPGSRVPGGSAQRMGCGSSTHAKRTSALRKSRAWAPRRRCLELLGDPAVRRLHKRADATPTILDCVRQLNHHDVMARLENLLGAWSLTVADRMAAAGRQVGLSASDQAAVVTLLAHPGRTVSWLGEVLALTSSGATRLTDRLVAAGLVVRSPGGDARQRQLRLTDQGKAVAQSADPCSQRGTDRVPGATRRPRPRRARTRPGADAGGVDPRPAGSHAHVPPLRPLGLPRRRTRLPAGPHQAPGGAR